MGWEISARVSHVRHGSLSLSLSLLQCVGFLTLSTIYYFPFVSYKELLFDELNAATDLAGHPPLKLFLSFWPDTSSLNTTVIIYLFIFLFFFLF